MAALGTSPDCRDEMDGQDGSASDVGSALAEAGAGDEFEADVEVPVSQALLRKPHSW